MSSSKGLELPGFTLVLADEKMMQLPKVKGLGRLPAVCVTVVTPAMAEEWLGHGEANYQAACVRDPSGIVAGGIDKLYQNIDRGDEEGLGLRLTEDEGHWVYAGIGVMAEKRGLPFEKQLTLAVMVDSLGHVRAGAGAITDLKEPVVAVVVIVSSEPAEAE